MKSEHYSTSGIGFFGLLTVALVVLKLLNMIEVSWFWIIVFPIIGPILSFIAISGIVVSLFGFVIIIVGVFSWIYDRILNTYYNLRKPS